MYGTGKKLLIPLLLIVALGTPLLQPSLLMAEELPVPLERQIADRWCWAACSEAILRYTGNSVTQCEIVNWVRVQKGWPNGNCCTSPDATDRDICNQDNQLTGHGSVQSVLDHWNVQSSYFGRALSLDEVRESISNGGPVVIGWVRPQGGTGHGVVLYGENAGIVNIMDPNVGMVTRTYASAVNTGTHEWKASLRVDAKKVCFVVDDTGSMWDNIDAVKSNLVSRINEFENEHAFIEYTLITYKDDVSYRGKTRVPATIRSWIQSLDADAGGDCPEEGYGALDRAAQEAPQSEIWWMTDADSHGDFLRMLQTSLRLILAGCRLHSVIMDYCLPGTEITSSQCDNQTSGMNSPAPLDEKISAAPLANVRSYDAASALSLATGGLFFAVVGSDVTEATEMILESMSSSADGDRLNLAAGDHSIGIPVDETVSSVRILVNTRLNASGSLSVLDPNGSPVVPGSAGVEQIAAGGNTMLLLSEEAIIPGIYTAEASSNQSFVFSVSVNSEYSVQLRGETTVGINCPLALVLLLRNYSLNLEPLGPGPGGQEAINDPTPGWLGTIFPFDPSLLEFFVIREDGSGETSVAMSDDGSHNDGFEGDGIFGGTYTFSEPGRYRIGVKAGAEFRRVSPEVINVGSLAVDAPHGTVLRPGESVTYDFVIRNLGMTSETYDITAASTRSWSNLATVPPSIALAAGASATISVLVSVPGGAMRGDFCDLSVTAASSSNPTINESGTVRTSVWTGPVIEAVNPASVAAGDTITITGSGFGPDPGAGSRSTDTHSITLAAARFPEANVVSWSESAISAVVPSAAVSGLLFVTADSVASNEVELVVRTLCAHPIALCRDVTVIADSTCMASASIDSGSYDCGGAPITLTQTPAGPYHLGETLVKLRVENDHGGRDSCTATVTVKEVTPPHISVELNKYVLWPPNHKMVDITARVTVTDDCCTRPTFMLVSITSNEPDNGKGDGNTIGDISGATFGRPDVAFQLRAERSGTGTGRIYTIVYAADDCSGNTAYDTVQVCVPHDGPSEYQDEQLPGTPRVTALLPSYPNPFNPTTRIPFDLATKERVLLQIFDTQGRLVRTLCDEVVPAGTHEALWDGRDNSGGRVATGVYFVRFTAGNYQVTRKLVMVR